MVDDAINPLSPLGPPLSQSFSNPDRSASSCSEISKGGSCAPQNGSHCGPQLVRRIASLDLLTDHSGLQKEDSAFFPNSKSPSQTFSFFTGSLPREAPDWSSMVNEYSVTNPSDSLNTTCDAPLTSSGFNIDSNEQRFKGVELSQWIDSEGSVMRPPSIDDTTITAENIGTIQKKHGVSGVEGADKGAASLQVFDSSIWNTAQSRPRKGQLIGSVPLFSPTISPVVKGEETGSISRLWNMELSDTSTCTPPISLDGQHDKARPMSNPELPQVNTIQPSLNQGESMGDENDVQSFFERITRDKVNDSGTIAINDMAYDWSQQSSNTLANKLDHDPPHLLRKEFNPNTKPFVPRDVQNPLNLNSHRPHFPDATPPDQSRFFAATDPQLSTIFPVNTSHNSDDIKPIKHDLLLVETYQQRARIELQQTVNDAERLASIISQMGVEVGKVVDRARELLHRQDRIERETEKARHDYEVARRALSLARTANKSLTMSGMRTVDPYSPMAVKEHQSRMEGVLKRQTSLPEEDKRIRADLIDSECRSEQVLLAVNSMKKRNEQGGAVVNRMERELQRIKEEARFLLEDTLRLERLSLNEKRQESNKTVEPGKTEQAIRSLDVKMTPLQRTRKEANPLATSNEGEDDAQTAPTDNLETEAASPSSPTFDQNDITQAEGTDECHNTIGLDGEDGSYEVCDDSDCKNPKQPILGLLPKPPGTTPLTTTGSFTVAQGPSLSRGAVTSTPSLDVPEKVTALEPREGGSSLPSSPILTRPTGNFDTSFDLGPSCYYGGHQNGRPRTMFSSHSHSSSVGSMGGVPLTNQTPLGTSTKRAECTSMPTIFSIGGPNASGMGGGLSSERSSSVVGQQGKSLSLNPTATSFLPGTICGGNGMMMERNDTPSMRDPDPSNFFSPRMPPPSNSAMFVPSSNGNFNGPPGRGYGNTGQSFKSGRPSPPLSHPNFTSNAFNYQNGGNNQPYGNGGIRMGGSFVHGPTLSPPEGPNGNGYGPPAGYSNVRMSMSNQYGGGMSRAMGPGPNGICRGMGGYHRGPLPSQRPGSWQ